MITIRVTNTTRGSVLGTRVRLADSIASRVRGFLFRPPPAAGEGILLSPCKAVHMFGVRFPLDVVFISEQGAVVATYPRLRPWRRSAIHGSALHALELPPGTIRASGTVPGDALSWAPTGAAGEAPDIERDIEPDVKMVPDDEPTHVAASSATSTAVEAAAEASLDIEPKPELRAESSPEGPRRQA